MKYIHSIDLNNWHVCWNLSLSGQLLFAKQNMGSLNSDINSSFSEITLTPTPRGITILQNKNNNVTSAEQIFEEVRSKRYNKKPSRFNCLWVAEDSNEGRDTLDYTFKDSKDRIILFVELLPNSNLHRVDVQWFDKYLTCKDEKFIDEYWSGVVYNNRPRWEILVDGGFRIENKDILLLRNIVRERHSKVLGKELIETIYALHKIRLP